MAKLLKKSFNLALIQLATGPNKAHNLRQARTKVLEAARQHSAKVVVLPECFNSPYGTQYFPQYAEPLSPPSSSPTTSPSYHALSSLAREANIYLIGGSIPEIDPSTNRLYNTSLTFAPDGSLLASHRKVHLFDIDIPGKIRFHESSVLSPGDHVTLIDLPEYGKVAVAICYDVQIGRAHV